MAPGGSLPLATRWHTAIPIAVIYLCESNFLLIYLGGWETPEVVIANYKYVIEVHVCLGDNRGKQRLLIR